MKTMESLRFLRLFCLSGMIIAFTGCMTESPPSPSGSFCITMASPNQFVVNGKTVDSTNLVKVLKKSRVPKDEPLVIEMTTSMSFESIRIVTQKLATAGYKPFFKSPRRTDASASRM